MVLAWGWPSVFWYGGLTPLLLLPVAMMCLPESVRYLVLKNKGSDQIARSLKRIAPECDFSQAVFTIDEPKPAGFPVRSLFGRGLAAGTVCLWLTFCANLLALYFVTSWLPTLIQNGGGSLTKASVLTSTYGAGVVAGSLVLGALMDRHNPHYVLSGAMLVGSVAVAAVGQAGGLMWLLVISLILSGVGTAGAQTGLAAVAAGFYPTAARATGVSWAMAIGRFGSIVGATAGGYMLAAHWGLGRIFLVVSVPLFIGGISILAMDRGEIGSSDHRAIAESGNRGK
jgi:AAHS family 4-hydroxybenzoate transporter-like MFS transporter